MTTETTGKTVLLIGGTGNLGELIARALLAKGAKLRLLVRPGSRGKLAPEVAAASEVVEDEAQAFNGVYSVVSAVQGGRDTIVDAQLGWLRAARAAGVRRFIPSDYSFNLFALEEGENINSDWRREFSQRAQAERGPVELVHILNGCFLDKGVLFGFLGAFDLERSEAYLWGDGEARIDLTTYADTAAYTAEAALDERALPDKFFVAGETLTFHELVAEVSAGLGQEISVKRLGSLDDLDAELDRRRAAQPQNMYAWLPLMYLRAMLSGKAKLGPLLNADYPGVQPASVREYVQHMVAGRV